VANLDGSLLAQPQVAAWIAAGMSQVVDVVDIAQQLRMVASRRALAA